MTDTDSPWFISDAVDLLCRMDTVHLASVSPDAAPLASVAPFVMEGGALYVFVSALAAHTANLRDRGEVAVLVARDEADCSDAFARPRLTATCTAQEEPRGTARWHRVLDRMVARFGDTAATVRELPDFALFRLMPGEGQVVSGFARARRLDADTLRAVVDAAQEPSRGRA